MHINYGTICNPTPPYTLTCNRDTRTLGIQIPANSYSHGDRWTCVGRNNTYDNRIPQQTDTTTVDVIVAPRIHALTVTDLFPWLARDDYVGRLSCDTTAGNPSTTRYTWYRDGTPVSSQTSQMVTFEPPISSDNGRLYKCVAENDFTDVKGSAPESNTETLDVEYAPNITLSACPDTANEADNYRCTCAAVGNPNPTVTWYPRDSSTNNILDLPSINRKKADQYTCNATSSSQKFGTLYAQSVLNLVVQYAPDVQLLVQSATEHDTHLVMTCNASGVPNVYTYGVWTHMYGTTLVRTLTGDVRTGGRTLTLASVSYQDSGTYTCQVQNFIRGRDGQLKQTGSAVFDVRGVPRLLEGAYRYITEKNRHLNITMTFISHPSPTEMFISKNARLSPTSDLNITFTKEILDDTFYNKMIPQEGYRINLDFPSFQINQEGDYQLTVISDVAENLIHSFDIISIDVPDTPTDLVVDQITTSAAVVSWRPGNNRGREDQQIHVWLLQQSSTTWDIIDVTEETPSVQLTNLVPATTYIVLLFATNEKGSSDNSTMQFTTSQIEKEIDDTSPFYRQMYMTSVVLICLSVIILLATIGIGIFISRFGHLPFMKLRINNPKTTSKPLTSIEDSEHAMTRITSGQERRLYTDLDTANFAAQNVYDQVSHANDAVLNDTAESNYEKLEGGSGQSVYEELRQGSDSSSKQICVNTSLTKVE
ncbi:neural cell adhesion molecule 2-like isoform X2 [Mizuhopecten yessoensis]|uniref:neural cell adhesion molecule 2-like isoform X2 n=1 Tax=Mizuhopecten yessoensis TaxID=6573 RepID=UPI000B45A5D7|nr:neural cell adhesion molecule 2-like isoform X2 [Mizuhopecten yessoensis]